MLSIRTSVESTPGLSEEIRGSVAIKII
jgi:hypothetical protein